MPIAIRRPKTQSTASVPAGTGTEVQGTPLFPLSALHLDANNARLGSQAGKLKSEGDILDAIVNVFGVDDVLSSLAVNGYFDAEPLVGVRMSKADQIRIAEGNRRLAACLILGEDPRARNHQKRTKEYRLLQERHRQPAITAVPVRVLTDTKSLLSYLGVRHIAALQPWDSYAKAAWVARVLEHEEFSLQDVSQMIGDQHRTVARILEGFYFVNQLIQAAQFNPDDSLRPGRGSNPEYPFSWVYTALGFASVREWLGLAEVSEDRRDPKPVKPPRLTDAGELMVFLFGNAGKGRPAAITDSRQIGDLARAVSNPECIRLLKRGKSIDDVQKLLQPAKERVADCLLDAQEALNGAITPLSQGEVKSQEARELLEPSLRVKSLASEVSKKIMTVMQPDEAT